MLAAPNVYEVYHQFPPGPSAQKLAVTIVLGEQPQIEESEVEAWKRHNTTRR
jgi:hypothetical protein